MKLEYLK